MYIINGTLITSKIWYKLITKLVVHKGELKNIGMIVNLYVFLEHWNMERMFFFENLSY
jgi:hypothetical protein